MQLQMEEDKTTKSLEDLKMRRIETTHQKMLEPDPKRTKRCRTVQCMILTIRCLTLTQMHLHQMIQQAPLQATQTQIQKKTIDSDHSTDKTWELLRSIHLTWC